MQLASPTRGVNLAALRVVHPPACRTPCRAAHAAIHAAKADEGHHRISHAPWIATMRLVCSTAAAVAVAAAVCTPGAWAATAAETFALKCAGCHLNGGNVLAAGASLFPDDLQRNGRTTPEAIYQLIYSGKGKMPGFGQECAPRGQCTFGPRLSDAEVQEQAEYVLERAVAGWKAAPVP